MRTRFSISLVLLGLCIHFITNPSDKWELTHYIWDFGLISSCDKGLCKNPRTYFSDWPKFEIQNYIDIKSGDLVFVQCRFLHEFCKKVLPIITKPIALLIADGDESFPSDCGKNFNIEELLNNPLIIHIFAQNNDYKGKNRKISSIPIGLDFHTIAYKGTSGGWGEIGSPKKQEEQLKSILSQLKPTYQRKKRAFVDFQLSDTMHGGLNRYLQFGEDRQSIFKQIQLTGLIDYGPWMRRSELWKRKGQYAFSISPHGNGLDCHRTWEDLVLGCIVIVKTSPLDVLYEGLPVVIINDWSEINRENMDKWFLEFSDAFTNPTFRQKLSNCYWLSKIKSKVAPFKGQ